MSYVKPPVYDWDKIKAGDIKCVSPDKIEPKNVKGNNQVHVSTFAPRSNAKDNSFRIKFGEPSMLSNVIFSSWANEDGTTGVGLKTHLDVYGDYAVKDEKGDPTKDEYGDKLIGSFENLDDIIADDIDSEAALKRKIVGSMKFSNFNSEFGKPMKDHMNPSVKVPTIEDDKSELYGQPDTGRTPSVAFAYWTGQAKNTNVSNLMIPNTNIVIYTKIFDHTNGISRTPITKFEQLEKFIYTKGDSKEKGIRPFRLKSTFETLPPTYYANSESKKGQLKFKLTEHHIFAFDYSKGNDEISEDAFKDLQSQLIKAQSKYVTQSQCPNNTITAATAVHDDTDFVHGEKRKHDDITPNDDENEGDEIVYNDSPTSYEQNNKRHKSNPLQGSEFYEQYRKDVDRASHQ